MDQLRRKEGPPGGQRVGAGQTEGRNHGGGRADEGRRDQSGADEGRSHGGGRADDFRGPTDGGGAGASPVSDLRIVLLGKNVSENRRVGNTILGSAMFHSEAPSSYSQQNSVRISGEVEETKLTVINTPHLFQPNLSHRQITQRVRDCVSLSAPGPHVILLVLQFNNFREEDRQRVKYVLNLFSKQAIKHTIVVTTDEETLVTNHSSVRENDFVHQLTKECGGGRVQFDEKQTAFCSVIYRRIEEMISGNKEYLNCEIHMNAEGTSVDGENSGSDASFRTELKSDHKRESKHYMSQREEKGHFYRLKTEIVKKIRGKKEPDEDHPAPEGVKLNLVLCGSDRRLKFFISNLILNQEDRRSELSSECVRRDVKVCGRLISLVELPALINTQLSEEEVMRQTLRCVSLCDPGVHVFIIIIPDAPINNEERAEMDTIQKIFSSRINKHTMILIKKNSEHQTAELNEETRSVVESFGGRHHFIGLNTHVSMLMEKLDQMVEANSGVCFSTETLWEAQMEKLQKFEEMKKRIHSLETWFQSKDSSEREDDLRIVLLGKTGVGKSSTANTILGREAFTSESSHESVTKECKRERAEINGRHVAVIDTPGLFDTELTNEEIKREISNCISMILPGPHVFLLLIPVGRFTQEEEKSVKIIQETFGEKSLMYTIVLFTRGDDLRKKNIEQYLGKPESALRNLIDECGNRYHVFNNNQSITDRTQVSDLLEKIDIMVKENGDSYYSCKMFREMEREIQEQQMKILTERVEQLKREKEELMNKHEEEKKRDREEWERQKQEERQRRDEEDERRRKKEQAMSDEYNQERGRMKMMVEEERQNHDKERKRREEEDERRRKIEKEMGDEYYDNIKKERERRHREREDLQSKHEEEMKRVKMMMEEERQTHDKERKRREEEFREREEQYKRDIKDIEDHERKMRVEMRREREEWERQKQQERQREEEEEKETQRSNELHMGTPEGQLTNNDEDSPSDSGCLRILMFGRTGNGKSATGNTILGADEFHSEDSKRLVTTICQKGVGEVDGKSVSVVDTPGLFDTTLTKEQVVEEIMKCVSLSAPGPHVFIVVLSLRRITQEKQDTLDMIQKIFGSKAAEFSIVLFTRGDELKEQTIEQYVEKSVNEELKKLIRDCGNRFLAFNNTEKQDRTQVTELLNMIEELKKSNEGRFFTNEMFEEAAIPIEKRREMIEENKRRNQAQVEELEDKYDMEDKRRRKRLEEKKQKTDEERVKLENKFREKEGTLRKEFEEKEKSEQKKQEKEDQKQSEEEKQRRDEYDQRIDEMKREIENQRLQYEKQLKEREEEDRKREEEYKQDQKKMKNEQEHIMAELRKKQEEEIKKRDLEKQMMKEQEEKKREEWKRKIKEAEDKEIQEGIKRHLRKWEAKNKRQMIEQEEEKRKIKEKHKEQLREKQEELEKKRKTFETEREEKQKREREEKEKEYEDERNEMKRCYEQLERERKEEWERRKREDEERQGEKRKRWEKMMEDLKQDKIEEIKRREKEERDRIRREEKACDEMKQKREEEIKKMKKKHEDEVRKQEEELNKFRKREDQLKERLEKLYELMRLTESENKWSCHVM